MKRFVLISILLILTIAQFATADPDRLKAYDKAFRNQSGQQVVLRGINWSEPWLCTRDDMVKAKGWGVNVFRIWMNERDVLRELGGATGKISVSLRRISEWARQEGVYVIFVMGDLDTIPTNSVKPWSDYAARERLRAVWHLIAQETWNNTAVLAYEFVNEPPMSIEEHPHFNAFNNYIASQVRKIAADTTLLIDGPNNADDWMAPYGFKSPHLNVAYSYHLWDPWNFTHASPQVSWPTPDGKNATWLGSRLDKIVAFRNATDAPVLIGEFGAMIHAPGDSEIRWTQDAISQMEIRQLDGIFWGYKSWRASSFHLYYNSADKRLPVQSVLWPEMLEKMGAYWQLNKQPAQGR